MVLDKYNADTEEINIVPLAAARPDVKEVLDAWQQLTDPAFNPEEQKPAPEIPEYATNVPKPPEPLIPQRKPIEPAPEVSPALAPTQPEYTAVPAGTDATGVPESSTSTDPAIHRKMYSEAQHALAYFKMNVQSYEKQIARYAGRVKIALQIGNRAQASNYTTLIAQMRSKIDELEEGICDLETISTHAYEQLHSARNAKRGKGLPKYANKEAGKLDDFKEPKHAVGLHDASNGLSMAQDANFENPGYVAETCTPTGSSKVLEEIMVELEVEKGQKGAKNGNRV